MITSPIHSRPKKRYALAIFAVLTAGALSFQATAATLTWDAGSNSNNNLGTAANWSPNASPAASDILIFPSISYFGNTPTSAHNLGTLSLKGLVFQENRTTLAFSNSFTFDGSPAVDAPSGGGTVTVTNTASVNLSGGVRQSAASNDVIFNLTNDGSLTLGQITNASGVVKNGSGNGTLFLSSTSNNYTGSTTINAGRLELASGGVIPDASPIILNGGTFNTGGNSETAGTLDVNGVAVLNMNGSGTLTFAASDSQIWTSTLSIWNWDVGGGTPTRMRFGNTGTALTFNQLNNIKIYDQAGTGFLGTGALDANGFLMIVPEPDAVLAGLGLVGAVLWRERRHFLRMREAAGGLR